MLEMGYKEINKVVYTCYIAGGVIIISHSQKWLLKSFYHASSATSSQILLPNPLEVPQQTRHKNVIMTSKWRRFDVIMTLSLRRVPVGSLIWPGKLPAAHCLKITFAPICECKNNRRIWRHNANTSRSRDVTDQLWWHHNANSEKIFLGENGQTSDRWFS